MTEGKDERGKKRGRAASSDGNSQEGWKKLKTSDNESAKLATYSCFAICKPQSRTLLFPEFQQTARSSTKLHFD
ncbi:hypothetical protein ACLOJK_009838 [Asimina triloba]